MTSLDPPRQHYGLTFAALALAAATFSLLQAAVGPALPEIQETYHASGTATAWVLTANLLSASVLTPILGRLGDMFGKEKTLLTAFGVLAAGTLICALSKSIEVLIAGRALQGAGAGIFPLAFGIVRDEFPAARVAIGISLISSLIAVGGGLGIVLSGPIVDGLGLQWLFWLPLILVGLSMVTTVLWVPESPVRGGGRIHWAGAALLSAWLICVLVAIGEGNEWGWTDGRTLVLLIGGGLLAVAWIVAESRAAEPLVDMKMMRIRGVWTVNLAAFMIGATMYSAFVVLPQFVETDPSEGYGFGASVGSAGLFLVPSTIAMLLISPIAGQLTARVGGRALLVAGSTITAISYAQLAVLHSEPWQVYLAMAIQGVGMGLAFASLANLIVAAVPPAQTGVAAGMNSVTRTIGGSVGTQVVAAVLAATVVGSALPTEAGFNAAFIVMAVAGLLAAVASLAVPSRPAEPALVSAGAAA